MVFVYNGKVIFNDESYDDLSIFNFFILLAIIRDYDLIDIALSNNPDFIFNNYWWFQQKTKEWANKLGNLEFYKLYDDNKYLIFLVKSEGSIKTGHYAGSVNEHLLVTVIQPDKSMRTVLFPLVYVRLALAVLHRNKELFEKYAEIVKNNIFRKSRQELYFSDFYGDHIIKLTHPVSFHHWTGAYFGITFDTNMLLKIQEKLKEVALGKIEPIARFRKDDVPLMFYVSLKLYRKEYKMWVAAEEQEDYEQYY